MKLTHADTALEIKSLDTTEDSPNHTLKGYASVFGNTDLDGDVISKGAFTESLKSRTPQLLVNHNMGELPVGAITKCVEDDHGLYFEAELPKADTLVSGRLAPQLRAGAIKGVSIGFRTGTSEPIKGGRGRNIKSAELFEISIVNIPANPKAAVSAMKSASAIASAIETRMIPIQKRVKFWEPEAALERVKRFTGATEKPNADFAKCFLYVDEANGDDYASYKHLIADVDKKSNCLKANRSALFTAVAEVLGRRDDGEADATVKEAATPLLVAYYKQLGLDDPTEVITLDEYKHMLPRQRQARLRSGIPCSKGLSEWLGQRDAGRTRRDAGSQNGDDVKQLIAEVRQLTKRFKGDAA